jgi:predicted alpha/beta-fold hydrolase
MKHPPLSCDPPFWAQGAHPQTLLGHFLPSGVTDLPWEHLNLKMADGDALRVLLARGNSDVVVHLFHGLGGNAEADYMRRASILFASRGHTILASNHRGAGEGRGLAARPYHMGCTADMAAVLRTGRDFFPRHTHVAVGFSLSATVLLLLLGRDARLDFVQPDLAIAVNPTVDLEKASHRLARGFNRTYDLRFVHLLRQHLRELWEFGFLEHPFRIPRLATLRDFDELYTAKAAGFLDRSDYYAQCGCAPHLGTIQAPTVLLTSTDDPFAPAADLEGVKLSPAVHLHVEATGGHMGYLGRGVPGFRWLDYALDHYVRELLEAAQTRAEGKNRTAFHRSEKAGHQGGYGGFHPQDARTEIHGPESGPA